MHPVRAQDVKYLHEEKEILLLNLSSVFLEDLRNNLGRIQTKPRLPSELWSYVFAVSDVDDIIKPGFVPVTIESYKTLKDGTVRIECLERTLTDNEVESAGMIEYFEEFTAHPLSPPDDPHPQAPDELWTLISPPNARRFSILVPAMYSKNELAAREENDALPARVKLFSNVRFIDFHARLWDPFESCRMCDGSRFICPGCTRGRAQEYDAFMGCGVDLACPHCMGLDVCMEDKAFNQTHYWESAPDEEEEERRQGLRDRLRQLGLCTYGTWVYHSPARERELEARAGGEGD